MADSEFTIGDPDNSVNPRLIVVNLPSFAPLGVAARGIANRLFIYSGIIKPPLAPGPYDPTGFFVIYDSNLKQFDFVLDLTAPPSFPIFDGAPFSVVLDDAERPMPIATTVVSLASIHLRKKDNEVTWAADKSQAFLDDDRHLKVLIEAGSQGGFSFLNRMSFQVNVLVREDR